MAAGGEIKVTPVKPLTSDELAMLRLSISLDESDQCDDFGQYDGKRAPRCHGGRGCKACLTLWRKRRVSVGKVE